MLLWFLQRVPTGKGSSFGDSGLWAFGFLGLRAFGSRRVFGFEV